MCFSATTELVLAFVIVMYYCKSKTEHVLLIVIFYLRTHDYQPDYIFLFQAMSVFVVFFFSYQFFCFCFWFHTVRYGILTFAQKLARWPSTESSARHRNEKKLGKTKNKNQVPQKKRSGQ